MKITESTKGTVNISNRLYTDYCSSSSRLKEYYCRTNSSYSVVYYTCQSGCVNGACNAQNQTNQSCTNECTGSGSKECSGNYAQTCGNYDNDTCLEWNTGTYCQYGCTNGECNTQNQTGQNQTGNVTFIRGDINNNRIVDIGDAIFLQSFLFSNGTKPSCYDAADANDNGILEIGDSIYILQFLFDVNVTYIPPPYPNKGKDPTIDSLDCGCYSEFGEC